MIVPVPDDFFPFTFCFTYSVVDLLNVSFLDKLSIKEQRSVNPTEIT